jgi:two-component system sensor histidine kinase DegS
MGSFMRKEESTAGKDVTIFLGMCLDTISQIRQGISQFATFINKDNEQMSSSAEHKGDFVDKESLLLHFSMVEKKLKFLEAEGKSIVRGLDGLMARYQIGERVIRAQEEERRRVAREIHDGPAQSMANVVLRTEICEKLLTMKREEVSHELTQLKQMIKDSLREIRKIIFDLRPMTLDDLGLIPTLHRFFENLRDYDGTPVDLKVTGKERRLNSAVEVAVFRTVQEAVNNARKHAQATSIQVEVSFGSRNLKVRVKDDGMGFDVKKAQEEWSMRQSFGILGMRERIELLDGIFTLKSVVGKGTTIEVTILMDK